MYLKKFLMSMDIILPHQAEHPFRVPARRLGYIQRLARERYKDDTLNLGDAGQKVRDLINEHLISLGINPKVPPMELLSEDFVERLNQHAEGNAEAKAKASEMEHAKGEVPLAARSKMKGLMEAIVETLQESIGSIDFWNNSDKQKIIDYIAVHELCHLRHRNHTEAYWNEVDKVMPQPTV